MTLEGKTPVYQLKSSGNLQEGEANPMRLLNPDGSAVAEITNLPDFVGQMTFFATGDPTLNVISSRIGDITSSLRSSAGVYQIVFEEADALGLRTTAVANYLQSPSLGVLSVNVNSTTEIQLTNYGAGFVATDLPFLQQVIISVWVN